MTREMPKHPDKLLAWTDGSCSSKDRIGGWAFIAKHGQRIIEHSGHSEDTTSSVMEMEALRQLLLRLKVNRHPLEIRSDSQYVVRTFTEWLYGWRECGWVTSMGRPVANRDIIEHIHELLLQHRAARPISLLWIRGHAGEGGNERCDELAGLARQELKQLLQLTSNQTSN